MAQGRRTDPARVEQVKVMLAADMEKSEITKKTGVCARTVDKIKAECKNDEGFTRLCEERKKRFVENAWAIIEKGQRIIDKSLAAAEQLDAVNPADMQRVSTVIGVQYDKQALALGEATQIVEGSVNITKFEDL